MNYSNFSPHYIAQTFGSGEVGASVQPCREKAFRLRLKSEDGYTVPYARYEVEFDNGESTQGYLDENGTAEIYEFPENSYFKVRYPDHADIRAKIFARRLKTAIDGSNYKNIGRILKLNRRHLREVFLAYQKLFGNDPEMLILSLFEERNDLSIILFLLESIDDLFLHMKLESR